MQSVSPCGPPRHHLNLYCIVSGSDSILRIECQSSSGRACQCSSGTRMYPGRSGGASVGVRSVLQAMMCQKGTGCAYKHKNLRIDYSYGISLQRLFHTLVTTPFPDATSAQSIELSLKAQREACLHVRVFVLEWIPEHVVRVPDVVVNIVRYTVGHVRRLIAWRRKRRRRPCVRKARLPF